MFNLLLKDIKNIVYDRKTLALIIIMPVVLMSILGAALKDMFSESSDSGISMIEIGVVKEYDYAFERSKFEGFLASGFFPIDLEEIDLEDMNPEKIFFEDFLGNEEVGKALNYSLVTKEEGEKLLGEDQISALFVLPKNYVYNSYMSFIGPGRNRIEIETIKNTQKQFSADIAGQILDGFLNSMNNIIAKKTVVVENIIKYELAVDEMDGFIDFMSSNGDEEGMDISVKEMIGGDSLNSFQYYSFAIMTMFLLYAASIGGKALIEEKNEYTLQRLEVAGIGILTVALSNLFRIMIIAILQSTIMIGFSKAVLSVNWGDLQSVVLTVLCSSFAVGGLGMLVSMITLVTDRYYVANVFEFGVVQLMALVGGSFLPIEILPEFLQKVNFIALNGTTLKMYLNGAAYKPLIESLGYILLLLGTGLVYILFSLLILHVKKRRVIV